VPNVKRLVYRSMPEETTRAAALKKGEIDIAYLLTGPVAEDIQRTPGFKLVAPRESPAVFWLDLPDQWDPKSPWHDKRVRQAVSLAIDRNALNKAETLGFSKPTGSLIPRALAFSRVFEADPYDPPRAKRLLAEAGYPNGFDAGDFYPWPPYFSMGEALASYLQQQILNERVTHVPIYELAFIWGVGPRVEEPGVNVIRSYAYSAPMEDLRLKRP
jgi:peptide/nickel transport system substrate-binding protein